MPTIDERIDGFIPRSLTGEAWAHAAQPVRALVRAAAPKDAEHAKHLLSRLCSLLAGSTRWDRRSIPDLATLLTADGIEAHCARLIAGGASRKTAAGHRTDLTRLATAAAGIAVVPVAQAAVRRPRYRTDPRLAAIVATGRPIAAVAAAWRELTGGPLGEHRLGAIIPGLPPVDEPTLIGAVSDAYAWLAAGEQAMSAPTAAPAGARLGRKPAAPAAPRRMSRHAALKHAAAMRAERQRLAAGPRIADAPTDLPEQVAEAIRAYRPEHADPAMWQTARPCWMRLMSGYRPENPKRVSNIARHIYDFLLWATVQAPRPDAAAPITPADLLTPGLIDAWVATLTCPESSKATQRTTVRRAIASLTDDPGARKIAHQPIAPPYTPDECEKLRTLADHQPTPIGRKNLSLVVALAAGAGLDGRDMRLLRRNHIHHETLPDGTRVLVVDVPEPRPRTTIVRGFFAASVEAALAIHDRLSKDPQALLLGEKENRTNVTTPAINRAVTAISGQKTDIDVARLRSAWLVSLMGAPVPLAVLLAAAGLQSARPIADLLPHCPPVPRETALEVLASAGIETQAVAS